MVSMAMSISPFAKSVWEDVQKKHDVPVNAIGMRIDPGDAETLKLWKTLGIDRFLRTPGGPRGHTTVAQASAPARPAAPRPPSPAAPRPAPQGAPGEAEGPGYYYRGNKVSR
jgi:hypothetical protein